MKRDVERKLRVFSKELNSLLNHLHDASKTNEKTILPLLLKNATDYCIQLLQQLFSWRGLLLALIPVSMMTVLWENIETIFNLPFPSLIIVIIIVVVLFIAWLRSRLLEEMSRIGSRFFHIHVYEKRREKEYKSLIALAKEKDFITTLKKDLMQEIKASHNEELETELALQQEIIEDNEGVIQELLEKLNASEELAKLFNERSDMAMTFLFNLKNKLTMLVQDQFNLDNINFGVNYSLYKIEDDGLSFIDGYGINKAEFSEFIPFKKTDNAFIQAIRTTYQSPLILDNSISWKRTLQDGSEWIISLHLDDSNREKFNYDTESGKLNVSLIQELLWICCELLNKFSQKSKS
ncbi:hypothetical protein MM221_07820 [Salipaludibacillus sp. LMS25]|jgi:hypothetical protein|uniref:hypothetical protein n=1 Tax=Salipaludibacillus sp. LMS25 TaxID=2924031 RepID=UPI0020D0848C|nr:hypothetical protein [Salipaludibacillus sp. LMS25]UTR16438.1 hypothetical protein MM221_07820 [Salipaludibacillus sp. LMS25]